MKVLVTGATGFLGQALCLYLKNKGVTVIGTGRNLEKGKRLEEQGVNYTAIKLDENTEALDNLVKQCDMVVHCAALTSPWGKFEDFYSSNVVSTRNICTSCLKNNIKQLVHISTPAIYFEFKDKFDIEETYVPLKFVNYYAQTKFLAEKEVDEFYQKGLSVITLRPRAIFGKGDTTLLPRLITANNTKFIPIMREEDVIIDLTHVDNVCEAVWLALNADNKYSGKKYNVTNDSPVRLIPFLKEAIEKSGYRFKGKKIPSFLAHSYAKFLEFFYKYFLTGKEPPFTEYSIGVLSKSQTLNISAIKKDLGYSPVISVEDGIQEVIEWLKNE